MSFNHHTHTGEIRWRAFANLVQSSSGFAYAFSDQPESFSMNYRAHTRRLPGAAVVAFALLSLASQARAHFLFIRLGPQAEAGRSAEVYLQRAGRCRRSEICRQDRSHQALDPDQAGRVSRAATFNRPPTGSCAAAGATAAWPSSANASTAFWLAPTRLRSCSVTIPRRWPAVADELNRLTPRREIPFEIQPTFERRP